MNPVVIDTNCLLQIISRRSPYRPIWDAFLQGRYDLLRLERYACGRGAETGACGFLRCAVERQSQLCHFFHGKDDPEGEDDGEGGDWHGGCAFQHPAWRVCAER